MGRIGANIGGTLDRRRFALLFVIGSTLVVAASAAADGTSVSVSADAAVPTDQIVVRLAGAATLDVSALGKTARVTLRLVRRLDDGSYVLKLPNRHALGVVRAITNQLASRDDVALRRARRDRTAARSAERHALGGAVGSVRAVVGQLRQQICPAPGTSRRAPRASRSVSSTRGTGRTRISPAVSSRATTSSATCSSRTTETGATPTRSIRATGSRAPRTRAAISPAAGRGNSSWHGTHVSGTIGAASNNALGVAGINWVSKIQPLRVLGKCGGYTTDIADAIRWAAGLPVPAFRPTRSRMPSSTSASAAAAPAARRSRARSTPRLRGHRRGRRCGQQQLGRGGLLAGQLQRRDHRRGDRPHGQRARTTRTTASTVEIAAPGGDALLGKQILSTLNTGTTTPEPAGDTYANYQGTSMATPHVVGVISLMLSVNPSLTPAQVTVDAAVVSDAVPGRQLMLDVDLRRRDRQRGGCGRSGERRRLADAPGRVRQDCTGQPGLGSGSVGDAAVGLELRRDELRVLRRHDERRILLGAVGRHRRLDVGDGLGPRARARRTTGRRAPRTPPATRPRTREPGGRSLRRPCRRCRARSPSSHRRTARRTGRVR